MMQLFGTINPDQGLFQPLSGRSAWLFHPGTEDRPIIAALTIPVAPKTQVHASAPKKK
jgi:hypothetical protein